MAAPTPARAEASFGVFYSDLSPYGAWQVSASYGRVWQPDVYAPGWSPYLDGHWVYTDLGWSWVSDYAWGGIPYHYGTWTQDPALGWVWVPGYVWAPAWVEFRTGPAYIGWAPVSPGFQIGIGSTAPPTSSFVFVAAGSFTAPRVRSYVVTGPRRATVLQQTKVVNRISIRNDYVVNRGPDPSQVERASGRLIRPVRIEQVPRTGPAWRTSREEIRLPHQAPGHAVAAARPEPAQHRLAAKAVPPGQERRDRGGHGEGHGYGRGHGKGARKK